MNQTILEISKCEAIIQLRNVTLLLKSNRAILIYERENEKKKKGGNNNTMRIVSRPRIE